MNPAKPLSMILRVACFMLIFINVQKTMSQEGKQVYLFSYFKGNGEDGLHLAYSEDGLKWTALNNDSSILKPRVGKEKLMRDPCIIRGNDGLYHMVWTASWQDKGIGYARSKDLVNWSEQQFIPVMEHEPGALNCWAPEITYDKQNKRYIIYWATSIPGRYPATDTTGDGKYNHRMYYVTTKDFKDFTRARVLYDKGFSVIDASIVPDGKRYIMFLKDETKKPPEKNIRVATGAKALGPYSTASSPITSSDYWAEGPTATRLNGKWVVYFDKYTQKKMGAVQSADLVKWEDISDKVQFPKGTRHGTVFAITRDQFDNLNKALPNEIYLSDDIRLINNN
jgi:hypothetical protein